MKSAEDFAAAIAGMANRSDRREAIKARDAELTQEVVEKCADAAASWGDSNLHVDNQDWLVGKRQRDGLINAILAVAKPPESPRERLGRVLWEHRYTQAWAGLRQSTRDMYMDQAEAVRQEIAKMREEG